MSPVSVHLAPNAPWPWLVLVSLVLVLLAWWAYTFRLPPLPSLARRTLTALRAVAWLALVWLLAMPVLERARPASDTRVTVLLDRSRSMELRAHAGGGTRAEVADAAVRELRAALRGRARVEVQDFAGVLLADSSRESGTRSATAPGDALGALAARPAGLRPDGVIVISDGAVNAGADPVAAARALGVKVIVLTGKRDAAIREWADILIATPGGRYADRVQELHIKVIHILIELVERRLAPDNYTNEATHHA